MKCPCCSLYLCSEHRHKTPMTDYDALEAELSALILPYVVAVQADIDDDFRADPDDDEPGIYLMIGADYDADEEEYRLSYQTGDPSFMGGAYLCTYRAGAGIYRDSDPAEVAREIAQEIVDLQAEDTN